jgi:hypothetical protein
MEKVAAVHKAVIEKPFQAMGLMNSIPKRFIVTTSAVALYILLKQPAYLFTKDGEPRPFNLTSDSPDSTPITWWQTALLAGALSVTFV